MLLLLWEKSKVDRGRITSPGLWVEAVLGYVQGSFNKYGSISLKYYILRNIFKTMLKKVFKY